MSQMIEHKQGVFTVSLDFELYWGMRDKRTLANYSENLLGVEKAIYRMLSLFDEFNIHVTWATVGFLFYDSVENLKKNLPLKKPNYTNKELSPYTYINSSKLLEKKYHFAEEIVKKIVSTKNQEIGTHTFSHYYCLESGQTKDEFLADLLYAVNVTEKKVNQRVYSLVFPRNQWNEEYLSVVSKVGILSYRGNEKSWIYSASNKENDFFLKRVGRLLDTYIKISGHNTYSLDDLKSNSGLLNIPSSRFLRPVSSKLAFLEKIRLKRIKNSMTYAAKNGELFHLWWHPHNFGTNLEKNLQFLSEILEHFKYLEKKYAMKSLNMKEISLELVDKNEN